jgi:hypothetical protein
MFSLRRQYFRAARMHVAVVKRELKPPIFFAAFVLKGS